MHYTRPTILATLTAAIMSAGILSAGHVAGASMSAPVPYGPAPAALTWHLPPDGIAYVPRGTCGRIMAGYSDLDVWARGGTYRTRQVPTRTGYVFRARGRTLARYDRARGRMCARADVRVYVWIG